jgi:O-methyltransferase
MALARSLLARFAPGWAYPHPPFALTPERLYAYLNALWERRELEGDILEIGCLLGGTTAIAERFLRRTGHAKRYVCIDTFAGFLPQHFDHDANLGTPESFRSFFSRNSLTTVERLLRGYKARAELVQGDIANMPLDKLPARIAVCLLDVDLEIPTYTALRRVRPLLVPGGIIMVDDCVEGTRWVGARVGYKRYVDEIEVDEEYTFGMGIVRG